MELQPLTPLISHIPHKDREKKETERKTPLQKKSKYSSWNKVLPVWSNHLIALGQMPVLGHLLGPGSRVTGQEPSPPSQGDTVAAWGAKSWGAKDALGASWPSGGARNSCSCRATVPTQGHFKKIGNPGRITLWTGSGSQDIFWTTLYQVKSKSSSLAFTVAEKKPILWLFISPA